MHSTSFRIVTYVAYMHSTLTNLHLAYQTGRPMPDANSSRVHACQPTRVRQSLPQQGLLLLVRVEVLGGGLPPPTVDGTT